MADVRWDRYPLVPKFPLARTWLQIQADLGLERVMNFRHLAHLKNGTRTADFGPISASGPRLLRLAAVRMVHNTL